MSRRSEKIIMMLLEAMLARMPLVSCYTLGVILGALPYAPEETISPSAALILRIGCTTAFAALVFFARSNRRAEG